ncbi:MAG: PepSY-like domain-containing protein [Muribaculaceae bacterium]|nr:PepSY-like domain-containing protein [Muribaculaceae bacterium]
MKKLLLTLILAVTFGGVAFADTYSHSDAVLPEAAKSVIKKNFKADVSVVKIDKNLGRVSEYEVILKDGSEVTFDSKGNWKDVEVAADKSVPSSFLLKPIQEYVKKNHPGQNIVGVEKEHNKIEVTLANGVEMKFDAAGKFLKYD